MLFVLGELSATMATLMEVVEQPLGIFYDNFLTNFQVHGVSLAILPIF